MIEKALTVERRVRQCEGELSAAPLPAEPLWASLTKPDIWFGGLGDLWFGGLGLRDSWFGGLGLRDLWFGGLGFRFERTLKPKA